MVVWTVMGQWVAVVVTRGVMAVVMRSGGGRGWGVVGSGGA
jgi:hypothetical protein